MITLRRATTTRSRKQTSLTSFPPPKFRRHGSGLLSTFLNSITRCDEVVSHDNTEVDRTRQVVQKPRTASTVSKGDIRPSTCAAAPPVQTEVVTVEPRLSCSAPNQSAAPIRRCSTRYISNNVVYEIIWDENSTSSSSDGELPNVYGQASLFQSQDLTKTETLERRLSKTLSQSRRESLQGEWRNKNSHAASNVLSMQSLWTNPKISRLFREPASRNLGQSLASKRGEMFPSSLTDVNVDVDLKLGAPIGASTNGVEFFPPLQSRANTNGSDNLLSPWTAGFKDIWGAVGRRDPIPCNPFEEGSGSEVERSRCGSMIGISSRTKRRTASAEGHLQRHWTRSLQSCSRGASESRRSDDEMLPLLQMT
ncbi:hypothetical protein FOPE_04759 [Fonsecaea pedrosoi]|nr:hypothetical protein FOPE_04759 [Fonsecaea pedrosoi]